MQRITQVPTLDELEPDLDRDWQELAADIVAHAAAPLLQKLERLSVFYELGVKKFGPEMAMPECAKALNLTTLNLLPLIQLSRGFEDVERLLREGIITDEAAIAIVRGVNLYGRLAFGENFALLRKLRELREKSKEPLQVRQVELSIREGVHVNVDYDGLRIVIRELRNRVIQLLNALRVLDAEEDSNVINAILEKAILSHDAAVIKDISTRIEFLVVNMMDIKNAIPVSEFGASANFHVDRKGPNIKAKLTLINTKVGELLHATEKIIGYGAIGIKQAVDDMRVDVGKDKLNMRLAIPLLTKLHKLYLIAGGLIDAMDPDEIEVAKRPRIRPIVVDQRGKRIKRRGPSMAAVE